MKIYSFETTLQLPLSLEGAWEFFSDPSQLSDITPPWMRFEVKDVPPQQMYPGMIIKYHLQPLLGVKLNWVTEITHVAAPNYFVDEQRFGPYRFWHHQHHFKENKHGTEMKDIVHYVLPFSVIGRTVHKWNIEKKLKDIFQYREDKLKQLFNE
ncbi:hypothetical protein CFK37_08785 [Virgibacillus phasianinus]|uniref:Cell division inhibitor n=1 Tax=Virgibacillus phasianinus TaxID=2017483 RepID=A0A220U2A3_9BACI|nr:SRPBCC family protein [Virgibacillus phasianinus]ASK62249.1 hypothetical protein CFK37_08785 [Virgibacillus phasianinus]